MTTDPNDDLLSGVTVLTQIVADTQHDLSAAMSRAYASFQQNPTAARWAALGQVLKAFADLSDDSEQVVQFGGQWAAARPDRALVPDRNILEACRPHLQKMGSVL